jgi:hypothetical protein
MSVRKPFGQKITDLERSEPDTVAKLGPDIKAKIGQQLRLLYGEIVNQGVPDRFVDILRELDDPSRKGSQNESS